MTQMTAATAALPTKQSPLLGETLLVLMRQALMLVLGPVIEDAHALGRAIQSSSMEAFGNLLAAPLSRV